ncbi:MAG TPA: lipid A deacylase LpxR family protein [Verrucomicrobiae bacterium]|nr:lipid A deacylase LpxR family protein [Verrucomicrobiae bacterium]
MSWRVILRIGLAGIAAAIMAIRSLAVEVGQGPIFALTEENDLFGTLLAGNNTDRHYTQGLKLTYRGADNDLPQWAGHASEGLPRVALDLEAQNLGYVFGQNIYTPEDLHTNGLIRTDRPYGGWLYVGMYLQRRGLTGADGIPVMEDFEIDAGVTGPPSLAETAQKNFHEWFITNDIPRGWDNQIKTEPGLLLKYERLWRLSPNDQTARYVDVIPHAGVKVGNIEISGDLGTILRAGWNLPDDFGVPIIDSASSDGGGITPNSPPFAWYLFAGVDGRAVGQNIFLDGNTLRNSASVDRVPWVADFSSGFAVRLFRHFQLAFTRVVRTHEFVGQQHDDIFGSFDAKAMFRF